MALRILSGLGGVLVLLGSALFSLGSSLAAPLGMIAARGIARRRGRPLTRVGSWLGATAASAIAVALGLVLLAAFIPEDGLREIQDAAAIAAQSQDSAQLPDWYERAFPRATRPDSVTQRIVRSPAFLAISAAFGLAFVCLFFGVCAGTAGWFGARLLAYAFTGRDCAPAVAPSAAGPHL